MTTVHQGVIPAMDVSIDLLRAAFDAALYATTVDDDGDLVVRGAGTKFYVTLSEDARRVRVATFSLLRDGASREEALSAVNAFNEQYAVARAYFVRTSAGHEGVVFDSDLTYSGGLIPLNLLTRFRTFESILSDMHPARALLT